MKLDIQPLDIQPLENAPRGASSLPKLDIQPLDIQPLDKPVEKKRTKTTWAQDIELAVKGADATFDKGISMPIGALASLFSKDRADKVFAGLDEREAARNARIKEILQDGEQTVGGKVLGAISTLPLQLAAFPFSPMSTGKTAIDAGESLGRSAFMTGVDTLGNMAGVALPGSIGATVARRAAAGAALNAGQDAAVREAQGALATTEEARTALGRDPEASLVAGVVGAGLGAVVRPTPSKKPSTVKQKIDALDAVAPKKEPTFRPDAPLSPIERMAKDLGAPSPEPARTPFTGMVDTLVNKEDAVARDITSKIDAEKDALAQQIEQLKNERNLFATQDELPLTSSIDPSLRIDVGDQLDLFARNELPARPVEPDAPIPESRTAPVEPTRTAVDPQSFLAKQDENLAGADNIFVPKVDNLASGVNKMALGKSFDMTAEERIQWNKAPGQLVVPEPTSARSNKRDFELRQVLRDSTEFVEKKKQIDRAFNQRVEDIRNRYAAAEFKARSEVEEIRREQELVDLENKLIQEQYAPKGDGQGPKTRAYISAMNRQRGGIDFTAFDILSKLKRVNKMIGADQTDIPADASAKSVIDAAKNVKEGKRFYNKPNRFLAAGSDLEAMKQNNPVFTAVGDIVKNWGKRSELWTRENVFPVEKAVNAIPRADLPELASIFKKELDAGRAYSPEELMKAGFSEKVALAHQSFRDLFNATLEIQNEARRVQGKEPIKAHEAYFASTWRGDYGATLVDKSGKTVWMLRAGNRLQLKSQIKAVSKQFPDLAVGKEFNNLNTGGRVFSLAHDRTALDSAYSTMVDFMGVNDPRVAAIKDFVEQETSKTADKTLGQTQHFKKKEGVRGYLGDRPWLSPIDNAKDFINSQVQYAKNASKWAEVQKATPNLREILNNPELNANQPKTMAWLKDYVARDLGFGQNRNIQALENGLAESLGLSPSQINQGVGNTKYLWVTQKLMMSPGYIASNVFQLANTMPWHVQLSSEGFKGNPAKSAAAGLTWGTTLASYHYAPKGDLKSFLKDAKAVPEYIAGAMEFAEKNSVTNRSVYDETGVDPIPGTKLVQASITIPETFVRSMAYMSFVQHLHDSGKFKPENYREMYALAERYTNMSMSDARSSERAPMFQKLGIVGNAANTLQTFTVNYLNQWAFFSRELLKGNPLPFVTAVAVQGTVAGAVGQPLVNDVINLWEGIKETLPNDMYAKVKDFDLKMWLLENVGEAAVYGAVSSESDRIVEGGVNFSTRLQAPQLGESVISGVGAVQDIGEQLSAVAGALYAVDDPVKWTQAMLKVAPPGLKEIAAQTLGKEYTQGETRDDGSVGIFSRSNIANRTNVYDRSAQEQQTAKFGVRSQKEALTRDLDRWDMQVDKQMRERRTKQVDKIYSLMRQEDDAAVEDAIQLWADLGGQKISDLKSGLQMRAEREYLDPQTRELIKGKSNIEQVKQYKRIKDILSRYEVTN